MESISELLHYYLGAFLFAAAAGVLLYLASLDTGLYTSVYRNAKETGSLFEEEAPPGEGRVEVSAAEAAYAALAAPEGVPVYADGIEVTGRTVEYMGEDMPILDYARECSMDALMHLFPDARYEKSLEFAPDGSLAAVRFDPVR